MRLFISVILYHIGDFISRTTMVWFNGFGYSLYRQIMLWSCDMDTQGRIWKYVKPAKNKRKRTK